MHGGKLALSFSLFVLFLFIVCFRFALADQLNHRQHVVATVEGELIRKEDISVSKERIEHALILQYGRAPTALEVASATKAAEGRKLIGKIRSIIRHNVLRKLGIEATTEEARSQLREIYPGLGEDPIGVLEKERSYFKKLSMALKEALKNPKEEKKIFEARLKGLMEYETWQVTLQHYNTLDKIALIEQSIPKTVEDIYKSADPAMLSWVLDKKLRQVINKDVTVTDGEVKRYFDAQFTGKKKKPSFEERKFEMRERLLEIKRQEHEKNWWQERYKKARIEIKDERYKPVFQMLIPGDESEMPY
jgi:hypothetical protein